MIKRMWFCVILVLALLGAVANAAPLEEVSVDINLAGHAVVTLSDGSFVLIGEEPILDYSTEGSAAFAIWISPEGEELWRYEETFEPGTRNSFYDALALENDHIVLLHGTYQTGGSDWRDFVVELYNGELVERVELDAPLNEIGRVAGDWIVALTGETKQSPGGDNIHYPRFVRVNGDREVVWDTIYDEPFTPGRLVPFEQGLYALGYANAGVGQSAGHQYIARINADGEKTWSHILPAESAIYSDALLTDEGNVLAVGGVYEAADGSVPAMPTAAMYTPEGTLLWDKTYDSVSGVMFHSVVRVADGYLAAGKDGMVLQEATLVLLDESGEIVQRWQEPVEGVYILLNTSVHTTANGAYLVVSGIAEGPEVNNPQRPHTTVIKCLPVAP